VRKRGEERRCVLVRKRGDEKGVRREDVEQK
jgi:hypothetical protein